MKQTYVKWFDYYKRGTTAKSTKNQRPTAFLSCSMQHRTDTCPDLPPPGQRARLYCTFLKHVRHGCGNNADRLGRVAQHVPAATHRGVQNMGSIRLKRPFKLLQQRAHLWYTATEALLLATRSGDIPAAHRAAICKV